jgi:undecaprenyl-diphosphatase
VSERVEPEEAVKLTGRAIAALVVVLLAALVLALLVLVARSRGGPVHNLDVRVDDRVNGYFNRHPGAVSAWRLVTNAGGPTTWRVLAAVAAVVLWVRHQRRLALLVAVAMAGAALLSAVVKSAVARARPVVPHPIEHVGGGSFPSGHAMTSFTALALLVLLVTPYLSGGRRLAVVVLAGLAVVAVGFSRLALGVHYVTDILGGWLIGALWLAAVFAAFRRAAPRSRRDRETARTGFSR